MLQPWLQKIILRVLKTSPEWLRPFPKSCVGKQNPSSGGTSSRRPRAIATAIPAAGRPQESAKLASPPKTFCKPCGGKQTKLRVGQDGRPHKNQLRQCNGLNVGIA